MIMFQGEFVVPLHKFQSQDSFSIFSTRGEKMKDKRTNHGDCSYPHAEKEISTEGNVISSDVSSEQKGKENIKDRRVVLDVDDGCLNTIQKGTHAICKLQTSAKWDVRSILLTTKLESVDKNMEVKSESQTTIESLYAPAAVFECTMPVGLVPFPSSPSPLPRFRSPTFVELMESSFMQSSYVEDKNIDTGGNLTYNNNCNNAAVCDNGCNVLRSHSLVSNADKTTKQEFDSVNGRELLRRKKDLCIAVSAGGTHGLAANSLNTPSLSASPYSPSPPPASSAPPTAFSAPPTASSAPLPASSALLYPRFPAPLSRVGLERNRSMISALTSAVHASCEANANANANADAFAGGNRTAMVATNNDHCINNRHLSQKRSNFDVHSDARGDDSISSPSCEFDDDDCERGFDDRKRLRRSQPRSCQESEVDSGFAALPSHRKCDLRSSIQHGNQSGSLFDLNEWSGSLSTSMGYYGSAFTVLASGRDCQKYSTA